MPKREDGFFAGSVDQLTDGPEIRVEFLDSWETEWLRESIEEIRKFGRPVVIDLEEGSKNVVLTIEQVGHDGQIMERRKALITADEDGEFLRSALAWKLREQERRGSV